MGKGHLRCLAFFVSLLAAGVSAEAQVVGSGMKLGFSGNGQFGENSTTLTNIIEVSHFRRFEGGTYITASTRSSGGDTTTSGFLFATLKYNFIGESLFVPFLHAGLGVPLETNADFHVLEYGGGFKAFFTERASFDLTGVLQTFSYSSDFGSASDTSLSLRYGLSFYFGG